MPTWTILIQEPGAVSSTFIASPTAPTRDAAVIDAIRHCRAVMGGSAGPYTGKLHVLGILGGDVEFQHWQDQCMATEPQEWPECAATGLDR